MTRALMRETTDVACAARSICEHCIHLQHLGTLDGKNWTCTAFPDSGIPADILSLSGGTTSRHETQRVGQVGTATYSPKTYTASTGERYRVLADWSVEVVND